MLYYFKNIKTQLKCKKQIVQCMEKVLWLIMECVKSGLRSFVLEISCWMMLHGRANQLKLIVIKLRHWKQSTLYHAGDSWHTQNVQINKVIGENEKRVFYFMEKKLNELSGQLNTWLDVINRKEYFSSWVEVWLCLSPNDVSYTSSWIVSSASDS